MPQITLEYSANIIEKLSIIDILSSLNHLLVDLLPTQLDSCKGRAIQHDLYCLGDNNPQNSFVHLDLKILPGRTAEKLEETGCAIIQLLKEKFSESAQNKNLKISVEIGELQRAYFKA